MPKMSRSSGSGSFLRKSTKVFELRKGLNLVPTGAVSRKTGITGRWSFSKRLSMAWASFCCQRPASPAPPRNTAADLISENCLSISGCHGMPGRNSHSSNQGRKPLSISISATFLTSGLSLLLWQRKTSNPLPGGNAGVGRGPVNSFNASLCANPAAGVIAAIRTDIAETPGASSCPSMFRTNSSATVWRLPAKSSHVRAFSISALYSRPSKAARIKLRRSRSVWNCGRSHRAFMSALRCSGVILLVTSESFC